MPIGEYHRLGPDWPDSAVVDHNIRTSATTEKPHGTLREITGRLSADQGIVYCGHTIEGSRKNSFTESEEQIKRDVMDLNYLYHVAMAGTSSLVIHSNGELEAGGKTRLEDAVPELLVPNSIHGRGGGTYASLMPTTTVDSVEVPESLSLDGFITARIRRATPKASEH